jgi:hypothetical protein
MKVRTTRQAKIKTP